MQSYLVETYLPLGREDERAAHERRARSAAAELTQGATSVGFGRTIDVPGDETCFFVFDAPSIRLAAQVAERAGLEPIRVVETVSSDKEET
jgi:hypothetical protein